MMENNSELDETLCLRKCSVIGILLRIVLMAHSSLTVWRAVTVLDNYYFGFLALANVFIIIEGFISSVKCNCNEMKWFSPCFFIYLFCTLPSLWLLEMDRFDLFNDILKNNNVSRTSDELSEIDGITLPIKLDSDTWVQILEQSFLFLLIFGRWILPHGALTRDELSGVLLIYIGSGSDVMELLIIFEEPEIHEDHALTLAFFAVWTLSLMQFTIVLPPNQRTGKRSQPELETDEEVHDDTGCCKCVDKCHCEILGLIIYTVLMDVPFFVVRMIALIKHRLLAYGIIFFALKNLMVIGITIYRVGIITYNKCKSKKDSKRISKQKSVMDEKAKTTNSQRRNETKDSNGKPVTNSNRYEGRTSDVQNGFTSQANVHEDDIKRTVKSNRSDTNKGEMHKDDAKRAFITKNDTIIKHDELKNAEKTKSDIQKLRNSVNVDNRTPMSNSESYKTIDRKEGDGKSTCYNVKDKVSFLINKENLAKNANQEYDIKKDSISSENTKSSIVGNIVIPPKINDNKNVVLEIDNLKKESSDINTKQPISKERNNPKNNGHNVDTHITSNQNSDSNKTSLLNVDSNQTTSNVDNQKSDSQMSEGSSIGGKDENNKDIIKDNTVTAVNSVKATSLSIDTTGVPLGIRAAQNHDFQTKTADNNVIQSSGTKSNASNNEKENKGVTHKDTQQKLTTPMDIAQNEMNKTPPVSYYTDEKGNVMRPPSRARSIVNADNKQTLSLQKNNTQNVVPQKDMLKASVTPNTKNANIEKSTPVSFYKDEKGNPVIPPSRTKSALLKTNALKDDSENDIISNDEREVAPKMSDVVIDHVKTNKSGPLPKDEKHNVRPPSRAKSFLTRSNRVADSK